jgi:Dockerin type I domain
MTLVAKTCAIFLLTISVAVLFVLIFHPDLLFARNITNYKDTISTSAPLTGSNHTLSFSLGTNIDPSGYIEITPPDDFEILSTSTFSADRNVELYVNGTARAASSVSDAWTDLVEIFPGLPGTIRYTLNPSVGIAAGSQLELRIGNNTSNSLDFSETYSTTTGTTTIEADVAPIVNGPDIGTERVGIDIYNGSTLVADAGFLIALVNRVGFGPVDTTEEIPPYRFNPSPTSTVTGVTLSVEIFIETDEFSFCKYSLVPGVTYAAMTTFFENTGLIYHTTVVAVTADSIQQFYIRCIDDEGNFNTDDYLLEFTVSARPTGTANTEGDVSGDGTGTGNGGTGSGSGSGGQSGNSDGVAPAEGGSAGTGGSGGGGGGGSGADSGDTAGGGFESTDAPYRSGDGRVVITGYAFPRSKVFVLVDGKAADNTVANAQGLYEITLDLIARGVYTFGVYALDPVQIRSSTFSTSFTVTGARTSTLSNINLAPSIKVTPDPVDVGAVATISGYTLPNATITIENEKDKTAASRKTLTAASDGNGFWTISLDTTGFSAGSYKVRAKAVQTAGISTNFSNYTTYGIGQSALKPLNADLNRDGKVNLVDFSILLFWWNSNGGDSDPSADINGDGKVSLTDFSILLFNWTG